MRVLETSLRITTSTVGVLTVFLDAVEEEGASGEGAEVAFLVIRGGEATKPWKRGDGSINKRGRMTEAEVEVVMQDGQFVREERGGEKGK